MESLESFIEKISKHEVKILNVCMVDLLGKLKCLTVSTRILDEDTIKEGLGFDGSSILGYTEVNESDLVAVPDPDTLIVDSHGNGEKVGFVLSYITKPYTGERLSTDPRGILRNFLDRYSGEYKFFVSPELEFFLLDSIKLHGNFGDGDQTSVGIYSREMDIQHGYHMGYKQGYFSPPPMDKTFAYRMDLISKLGEVGIEIIKSHHEVASAGQIEINFAHKEPLKIADWFVYTKNIARAVAEKHGLRATFMPKVFENDNGSGLHIHLSVWDSEGKTNLFFDPQDAYAELSDFARYFIGGILAHAKALSAILAPTVNSYKRLVPGYEAPVYLSWGRSNRSVLIRVPFYSRGSQNSKRIEIRFPDPLTNIYLALTSIIACGMDGVKKKVDPGEPLDIDLYSMDRRARLEIESLPRDLWEALDYLEEDRVIAEAIGREAVEKYIEMKREEYEEYSRKITPWEYERYLVY